MGNLQFGWGRESGPSTASQFELRTRWEVTEAGKHFKRIFNTALFGFVGRIVKVFSPPQSTGLLFQFVPGMHHAFAKLVDAAAAGGAMVPDDPGVGHRDAWWRRMAAGASIGASFREPGTQTMLHVAFNRVLCDVHVDRNAFVTTEGGYPHWNLNGLLRHLTMDLAGDKLPWVLASVTEVNRHHRPIFEATLGPWLAVDLPSRDHPGRTEVKIGVMAVAKF
jgi:hypothetical protein